MAEKLTDHDASIDVDDDGDIFIEMIFPNGRVGISLGHTLSGSALYIIGGGSEMFRIPQSDEEMNAFREKLA